MPSSVIFIVVRPKSAIVLASVYTINDQTFFYFFIVFLFYYSSSRALQGCHRDNSTSLGLPKCPKLEHHIRSTTSHLILDMHLTPCCTCLHLVIYTCLLCAQAITELSIQLICWKGVVL